MKKANHIYILSLFISISILSVHGQGVMFSEYRAILTPDEQHTLQLCNPTATSRTFTLSFIDRCMQENGSTADVPDSVSFPQSLRKNLRIFPRRVTLDAGKCQTVQIQLKNTSGLPDGEYRSYLLLRPAIDKDSVGVVDSSELKSASPQIIFRLSSAIPMIYRKNTRLESVSIDHVQLIKNEKGETCISFDAVRKGTQSCYGRMSVTAWEDNKPVVVGEQPGSAIHIEISKRKFVIPIKPIMLDKDATGKITFLIQYISQEQGSAKNVLAEWSGAL